MILLTGIGELATMAGDAPIGDDGYWEETGLIDDAAVLVDGAMIVAAGPRGKVEAEAAERGACEVIDCGGRAVVPGFVDPHTHPVFGGTREHEFVMRLKGRPYTEIAAAGGGILSTVSSSRAASEAELAACLRERADRFLQLGTTTVEAKSGYGLETETELRMLRVLDEVDRAHDLDLIPTFLGAHEVPAEWRHDRRGYLDLVVTEMLPAVQAQGIAQYCDVFCEKGVFEIEESRQVLVAGAEAGLGLRVHADEIYPLGGAELCAELGAATADHLVQISDAGIEALAESGTVAVLLPATSLLLRLERDAPARRLIAAGARVALATDFNPGTSWCQSLPLVIGLAAARLGMTPYEGLRAATRVAADSLGATEPAGGGECFGRIQAGARADLVVLDVPNHRHLAYQLRESPIAKVIKRGRVVQERSSC